MRHQSHPEANDEGRRMKYESRAKADESHGGAKAE
jgi:hypothetical protein